VLYHRSKAAGGRARRPPRRCFCRTTDIGCSGGISLPFAHGFSFFQTSTFLHDRNVDGSVAVEQSVNLSMLCG
jgi:hypothetical protein